MQYVVARTQRDANSMRMISGETALGDPKLPVLKLFRFGIQNADGARSKNQLSVQYFASLPFRGSPLETRRNGKRNEKFKKREQVHSWRKLI